MDCLDQPSSRLLTRFGAQHPKPRHLDLGRIVRNFPPLRGKESLENVKDSLGKVSCHLWWFEVEACLLIKFGATSLCNRGQIPLVILFVKDSEDETW